LIKNFKFWTGFFIIFGLIASSIIFSVFFDSHYGRRLSKASGNKEGLRFLTGEED
jgi:hypothetical protein